MLYQFTLTCLSYHAHDNDFAAATCMWRVHVAAAMLISMDAPLPASGPFWSVTRQDGYKA